MVNLQRNPTKKRPNNGSAGIPSSSAGAPQSPLKKTPRHVEQTDVDVMLAVLAEAGCTLLCGEKAPTLAPAETQNLQRRLDLRFSSEPTLIDKFLAGLSSFIEDSNNFRRILECTSDTGMSDALSYSDSIARVLLLVAPLQSQFYDILLEKLPEHFNEDSSSLKQDIPRLILNQFRWLDFLVDAESSTRKLLDVLSICPLPLKKEIISFLPDIIGDQSNGMVVSSLEQMLQEDMDLIVPILDAFSNINLEDELFEQVVTIALSSLRTVDAEYLPLVLRFLLQSATTANSKRIVEQIRENLNFIAISDTQATRNKKLKGKLGSSSAEALILDTIRFALRFKSILCETILKEIKGLERECDHRVIDIWLLLIIYANGGPLRKSAEKIMQKKALAGYLNETLLHHCIGGRGESLQVYFQDLLSISESLLTCKELPIRKFGVHAYSLLFEEFVGTYHRQEVLGSLVTHTGSGVAYEVNSALDTLVLLATKHSQELLPVSSYINGILDYLEGFQDDHLEKVYIVFSRLALESWSGTNSCGSSIANELLMIVRKQIANPDLRYKRMGIIGVVKLVASLGGKKITSNLQLSGGSCQKTSTDEALSLLEMVLETCKSLPMARGFFYDELTGLVDDTELHPFVVEWVSKHTGEFEMLFLLDLESGKLQVEPGDCGGLQGELWMNLDGEVSPICLNVLPLLTSYQERSSQKLEFLPANFFLLAAIERLTNQGSLESIDALLGCPLYLPKHQILFGDAWKSLAKRQKQVACLSLYYGICWIRELVNAFSTQIVDQVENVTQVTREETASKLLKRIRNLLFLECLLNTCLKLTPLSLPQLHSLTSSNGSVDNSESHQKNTSMRKKGRKSKTEGLDGALDVTKSQSTSSKSSQDVHSSTSLKQSTISDAFKKVGGLSQQSSQKCPGFPASSEKQREALSGETEARNNDEHDMKEISSLPEVLEMQRYKLRPLTLSSLLLLSRSQNLKVSCCADPAAELPLYLYLLRDFRHKLDSFDCPRKLFPPLASTVCKAPSGLANISVIDFLKKVQVLFPSLRKHLDSAVSLLNEDCQTCQTHWINESVSSGNPQIESIIASRSLSSELVFKEILCVVHKILGFEDLSLPCNVPILRELLQAFQSSAAMSDISSDLHACPPVGSLDFCFYSAYEFLDGLFNCASSTSFMLASELIMALKALVNCAQACAENYAEGKRRRSSIGGILKFVPKLCKKVSASAHKLLEHNWDSDSQGNIWKSKGDVLQKVLQIYIGYSESPVDCLEELACRVMPQMPAGKSRSGQDSVLGFPALSSATFTIWYRVQHEEILIILNKVIKEITTLHKSKAVVDAEHVEKLLSNALQCVNIVVSLISLTKVHDKAHIHAMAVKYGGRFVDIFLKGFEFLQAQYDAHKNSIITLVKELQKATRTIQTLCSEAKGFKRTAVTSKVPVVKRSMERYVFCVKALLHSTSHGDSFWMGNLKHKDLQGREISSQLHVSEEEEEEDDPLNNQPEQAETDGDEENSQSQEMEELSDE
ncbi:uncharacterized protein LOC131070824 isoform X1 [Cryptomeria japonica]|uniref:uncharacterized protein LOC131070824 isoform X1 n=1 Tax=Cryptomeria japonica TaxID=3369 RepID=UPI0027D9F897|nr:uncharacterized protein LOC131070824 isoform X1 [Cryptomeria japonica]